MGGLTVNRAIQVRITGDGRFQARRLDGLPLTEQDKAEARRIAVEGQGADPTEGRLIAVKICSQVLDACIWFSFDPDFKPDDDEPLAVFYDHEVQFLRNKTVEQLKEIHQWKLTVGSGARIRQ
jgi:hypothetical protein